MTIEAVHGHSSVELVRPRSRAIPAHVTIKHWQLKSLLCRDSSATSDDRILYCSKRSIRALNPNSNHTSLLCSKLSFEPRSICSNFGCTVAGAEDGTIAVVDSRANKSEYDVGDSLINGIHIYESRDSQKRALLSSNDYSLKMFNLNTMSLETPVSCSAAMNHASVSPDGKMMAAVGDSPTMYVWINDSGRWKSHGEITVAEDSSFACVFSPSGDKLAVGSQDGTCSVLDLRMLSESAQNSTEPSRSTNTTRTCDALLYRAMSTRPVPQGSIRSVSWSPTTLDLLLFTESSCHATILDCRDFTNQQRLRLPDSGHAHNSDMNRDNEISGATWSKSGSKIYIGHEQYITEFEVDTHKRRTFPSITLR